MLMTAAPSMCDSAGEDLPEGAEREAFEETGKAGALCGRGARFQHAPELTGLPVSGDAVAAHLLGDSQLTIAAVSLRQLTWPGFLLPLQPHCHGQCRCALPDPAAGSKGAHLSGLQWQMQHFVQDTCV